ncbi:complexed with cef1p [Elasticomyces elasticus]|nr:complexed with cef1p [Elasticomyces elasticus]
MTTAHRPTFDPARGKDAARGPAYHQRLLPAHKTLKHRQAGQGTASEHAVRDLRAELLAAERRHFAKKAGRNPDEDEEGGDHEDGVRLIEDDARGEKRKAPEDGADAELEDAREKRRKILEEAHDIDADSDRGSSDSSSDSDDSDEEDEEAELMRELARIKAERAEKAALEAAEKAALDKEQKEFDIARGNPLLNPRDFKVKRRWDDDVVFKNQARGTEDKKEKEFVNDLLRSDFHKRFMSKYVR